MTVLIRVSLVLCILFFQTFTIGCSIHPTKADEYFASKYQKEVELMKEYLWVLANNHEEEIKKISTSSSNFLKPVIRKHIHNFLTKVDINNIKTRNISEINVKEKNALLIEAYFEEPDENLRVQLVQQDTGKWLLDIFTISDHYYYEKTKPE